MSFDLVTKLKMHFGQQRAHMVHEQHQLVDEGEAQTHCVRHRMESEHRASFRILESVSKERDLVRQEALHLHDNYHRSEQAALLPGEDVDEFTFQFGETRQTGEYFHDVHERNLTESHRIAALRDRSKLEGRTTLRTYDEEDNISGAGDNNFPCRPSPTKREPAWKPEVSNQTGTSPSEKESRPPCVRYKKKVCFQKKHELQLLASSNLRFFFFHQKGQCRYQLSPRPPWQRIVPNISRSVTQ